MDALHAFRTNCTLCNHSMMAAGGREDLRRTIADGLAAVKASTGLSQLEIAAQTGLDVSKVSRMATAKRDSTDAEIRVLVTLWPEHFDVDHIAELRAAGVSGSDEASLRTTGLRRLPSTEAVYEAAANALERDPKRKADCVIRHVAMHLDRRDGSDPTITDDLMDPAAVEQIERFVSAMRGRAREGWYISQVVSVATPGRVDLLEQRARALEGANVVSRAYAGFVPPVPNLLLIANRDVFLAVDHPRFERPQSALLLRSTTAVEWATDAFDVTFQNAPFVLRDALGIQPGAFAALREALGGHTVPGGHPRHRLP